MLWLNWHFSFLILWLFQISKPLFITGAVCIYFDVSVNVNKKANDATLNKKEPENITKMDQVNVQWSTFISHTQFYYDTENEQWEG